MFINSSWPLPDVPSTLIVDFDLFNVQPIDGDLHAGWHRYQNGPPFFYTPLNGGHWVVTQAAAIFDVFRSPDIFSNSGVALIRDAGEARFIPGELDPPRHADFRAHLNPEASPRRVKSFETQARQLAQELIDAVVGLGEIEFQSVIGHRLPIHNFLVFLGLPKEDSDILLPHVEIISRSPDAAAFQRAFFALQSYLDERLEERRATPRDDFLGRLVKAKIGERQISIDECRATAINVLLGGLDTVTASMGFFINFLARNPVHRRQLVDDPALIPEAMEELFRRHGIFNTARLVKEDCEFHGMHLRKSDLVLVPTALYNLDEKRFPRPLDVDFKRSDKNHLTFAVGIHRCLGSNFARVQLQVLLQEWLLRIPDFEIAPGRTTRVQSGRSNTVMELPLVW